MDDEEPVMEATERYQLLLWMQSEGPEWRYSEEHWFRDRPETGIVLMLFDEAKRTFGALYPDVDPGDFSVSITRLRPVDDFRPDFRRLMD